MMSLIVRLIYMLEVAGGRKYVLGALGLLAATFVIVGYSVFDFTNMKAPEAMDSAQLARNIADGKGYTTLFVRPLSLYLVKQQNQKKFGTPSPETRTDYSRIRGAHPDIANPPVYPVVLAGLMKLPIFNYTIPKYAPLAKPPAFWTENGRFARYQPDFWIAVFNELLLLGVIAAVFFWARRMFDATVAWASVVVLFGAELLWRFSVSGLSTIFLMLIFMGLVWCLTLWERETREPKWGVKGLWLLAAGAGVMTGVGCLTRYAFGWMIVPVLIFLILFSNARRIAMTLVALAAFAAVVGPWVARNYSVSGLPFGTATYAAVEGTGAFNEYQLERSLAPDFSRVGFAHLRGKLIAHTRAIVENDIARIGGTWVSAFFLVGLLIQFRSQALQRLRYFLLMSLGVLIVAQAMGRTQLSDETPDINSENLLVLLAPLVVAYGASLFFVLLEQIRWPLPKLRYVVMALSGLLVCMPMIFAIVPSFLALLLRSGVPAHPVSYPPYFPPLIQQSAFWMKENELMMSDVPWAVAWYGRRQCVWLTLNAQDDFFAINDLQKPVQALYLTPETMDSRFLSQWVRAGEKSWGSFILESLMRKEVPPNFPLREMPAGFLPEQLFLSDWRRWQKTE